MSFRPFKPRKYGTIKDAVSELYKVPELGGPKSIADSIERSESVTQGYSNPQEKDEISLKSVLTLTKIARVSKDPRRLACVEILADGAGCALVPLEQAEGDFNAIMAREARAQGDFCATVWQRAHASLKDKGGADAQTLRDLRALANSVLSLLAALSDDITAQL